MLQLGQNAYNKTLARSDSKFKLWTSAGLMLSYKCSAACSCCYCNCAPEKDGLMDIQTAIDSWQGLINISGESAKVHLTGGEVFLYPAHLETVLEQAAKSNIPPADLVETNAFWAVDEDIISKHLKMLDKYNVHRLKISYDPFHAEFVPLENIKMLYEAGCRLLGRNRIMLRWQYYLENPPKLDGLNREAKFAVFAESHRKFKCRFTGRAARQLAPMFADKPISQLSQSCKKNFLDSKSIHIDPFGNVFNGVCSGIIIGNVKKTPLDKLWQDFNPTQKPIIDVLFSKGPAGFLEKAIELGYQKDRLYGSKCHLCSDLRQFFFDKGYLNNIISPKQCYL